MFHDVDKELMPEEVEKLIDNFARDVVKTNFEGPALLLIRVFSPLSRIFGSTWMLINWPILELFGFPAFDFALILRNRENIDKLINKIDELIEEKEKTKKMIKKDY